MIIGLSGKAGVGKDTVANFLVKNHGFTRYAFADAVRNVALAIDPIVSERMINAIDTQRDRLRDVVTRFGWDLAKREVPEVRRLLQVIGTEAGRMVLGENVWVNILEKKWIDDGFPNAVITDMRFPNEVTWVDSYNYESATVRIERPDNPNAIAANHASEAYTFDCEYTLINDGSLDKLESDVSKLYQCIVDELAFGLGG